MAAVRPLPLPTIDPSTPPAAAPPTVPSAGAAGAAPPPPDSQPETMRTTDRAKSFEVKLIGISASSLLRVEARHLFEGQDAVLVCVGTLKLLHLRLHQLPECESAAVARVEAVKRARRRV